VRHAVARFVESEDHGSIPGRVSEFFQLTLKFTQRLTEMSTGKFPWRKARPSLRKAEYGGLDVSQLYRPPRPSTGIAVELLLDLFQKVAVTASVILWPEFLPTDPESRVRFPAPPESLRVVQCGL
jgi:hypothetical protein